MFCHQVWITIPLLIPFLGGFLLHCWLAAEIRAVVTNECKKSDDGFFSSHSRTPCRPCWLLRQWTSMDNFNLECCCHVGELRSFCFITLSFNILNNYPFYPRSQPVMRERWLTLLTCHQISPGQFWLLPKVFIWQHRSFLHFSTA